MITIINVKTNEQNAILCNSTNLKLCAIIAKKYPITSIPIEPLKR